MEGAADELVIGSRYGALRDLLPVYTPLHVLAAVGAMALLALMWWFAPAHPPIVLLMFAALQWQAMFAMRPAVLTLTPTQAKQIEATMAEEGHFVPADIAGQWEAVEAPGKAIELFPASGAIEVRAPRRWLEAIRAYLEWLEEGGVPGSGGAQPFQIGETPEIPWHAKLPAIALPAVMVPLLFYDLALGQVGHWGLSGAALAQGRYETILLHMISHGSIVHVVMNVSALLAIGPGLAMRLGRPPLGWLRFALLFVASGLAGAAFYLMLHPFGQTPMVGASGAIYGLVGLLVRLPHNGEELLSFRSRNVRRMGLAMIRENVFLFALLGLVAWSSGSNGGLAWEAHLSGFLFGFFVGPRLLPRYQLPTAVAPA